MIRYVYISKGLPEVCIVRTRSLFFHHRRSFLNMPEHLYATDNADFEHLLSLGFSEIEATRLVYMKDHVTEQIRYREMLEEQNRLDFVRRLLYHDRLEK